MQENCPKEVCQSSAITAFSHLPNLCSVDHRHHRIIPCLQSIVLVSGYNHRSNLARVNCHCREKIEIEPGQKQVLLKLSTELPCSSPALPSPLIVEPPPSISPLEIYCSKWSFLATATGNIVVGALKSALHHLRSHHSRGLCLLVFATVKSYPMN